MFSEIVSFITTFRMDLEMMRLCDHFVTERGCSLPKTKNAFRKTLSQSKLTCCHRCPNRQICGTPEAVCPNHRQGSLVNSELKTVGRMVQHIQWIQWSIGFRLAHTLLSWFCFCGRHSFFSGFCFETESWGNVWGQRLRLNTQRFREREILGGAYVGKNYSVTHQK